MTTENSQKCPNCNAPLSPEFNYCSQCGQKNKNIRITIWEFIIEFFNSFFNIDNRFFQTVFNLFIPGKLSKYFISGKRKKYYHPLRIYLVCIILFFFILSLLQADQVFTLNFELFKKDQFTMQDQIPHLRNTINDYKELHKGESGLYHLDSVYNDLYLVAGKDTIMVRDTFSADSSSFNFMQKDYSISNHDLALKNPNEIVAELEISSWIERLFAKQFIKAAQDVNSLNNFIYSNLTWLLLALIPLFAIVLKLFYIRRKKFYVEHFVFLLHIFSALLLVNGAIFVIMKLYDSNYLAILYAFNAVFPFFSFKKYYEQSWLKTFIKFIFIGIFFVIIALISMIIFMLITALLF